MYNSLLICIAFHYDETKPNRLWFIHQTIINFVNNYKIKFDIIIDTNDVRVKKFMERYKNVNVIVHDYLIHPYHLVWMHRRNIRENIDKYDVVMYTEDDHIIPYYSFLDYLEKIEYMFPKYVPCFERLEWSNTQQCFVALDINKVEKVKKDDIIHIKGKRFFSPKLPYHGFWIMPSNLLKKTIAYKTNFCYYTLYRDHAASLPLGPPELNLAHDPNKGECNTYMNMIPLFELNEKDKISDICLVYHISNNYSDNKEINFGKIPIDNIVEII